jgi:hypothetical protein
MDWKVAKGGWLWAALAGVLLVSAILIALLMQMPPRFRRPLLNTLVFLAGLFYALEFFLPTHIVTKPNGATTPENFLTHWIPDVVSPFADILGGLLLGLGLISLFGIHINNVTRQRAGWVNSAALLLSAAAMMVIGLLAKAFENPYPIATQLYDHLFNGLQQNMQSAMFSLIAFYILSAAYRAFRIRSLESSILMASALIVLLGLSFGVILTSAVPDTGLAADFRIETWSNWILTTISSPALRAIDFGVGLGGLAMALRIWLGIERGALFGD